MKTDKRTKYKCGFYNPAFYAVLQLNTFTKFRWTFLVATVFEILKLFVCVFRCTPFVLLILLEYIVQSVALGLYSMSPNIYPLNFHFKHYEM